MEAPMKLPGHSGKLSDKTLFQNDDDGLVAKIWELKMEKEKLECEINKSKIEIDGWLQILSCKSTHELDDLINDFSATPSIMPDCTLLTAPNDLERLDTHSRLVTRLDGHDLLDRAKAYKTGDGDLFIKFPWWPPSRPNYECYVLLKIEDEHKYSLRSHNLPPTVPTENLAKKYLETPRHGAEGLRKFVAVMGKYTKALYYRLLAIMVVEDCKILNNLSVYYNRGVTQLNFLVNPRLKNYPTLMVEFVLKYDPLDLMPESVVAEPLCLTQKDKVPPRLKDVLKKVTDNMKTNFFPQVLMDLDTGRAAKLTSSSLSAHVHTDSEEETLAPLFDIGE